VIVTDASSCTSVSYPFTITQPAAVTLTSVQTNISCFGASTGAIDITPAGGTSPYTFAWTGTGVVAGAEDQTGLTPGSYSVIVTDASSCTSVSYPFTITQPAAVLTVTTSQINVFCFGGATGTATAIPAGGTGPYTYSWNTLPVQTTITATGLSAGPYTVTVTDANLCTATANVTITQPAAALTVTTSQVNILCFGASTGTATAIPAGGTGIYTYSWNTTPAQTTVTATGLSAGIYTVTVSDGNGCTATASPTISQPASALSGTISQSDVTVPGGNNGSVTVSGSGGTAPYQYQLGSGTFQSSGTFGTLTAGSYTVTVQDNNGCTVPIPVIITQPAATLSGTATQTNASCFGSSNGSITVTGIGGVPPYDYSLNGGTYQTSGTFGSLAAGAYTVRVRDAALNTFDVSATIDQPASAVAGSLSSQTNVLCFGGTTGSVTVSGSGGTPPYQYKLGSGAYQTSGSFATIGAGTYTITVQDANLCMSDVSVTITQPAVTLTVNNTATTNTSCAGSTNGIITVTAAGGTSPYTYSLNEGTAQVTGTFANLAAATYTITATDANLCTANTQITVTEPEVIAISSTGVNASCPGEADGSITLTITGGSQPYNVIWSDGKLTQGRQKITDGTYSVVVTDINGCAKSLDVVVGITGSDKCIEIPDIITPNNDGFNDTWKIKNIDMFPNAEVFVFTRWGKLVFKSKNLAANPWNGTFKGKLLPADSYHYILHLNDGSEPRSGAISIIR
jgi:gliding motility-associated-like protein